METQTLRKLSSKTILGKTPDQPPEGETVALYMVYGVADGVARGNSDYGAYVRLLGNFEAVRLADGQVFNAPQCFLPQPFDEMIAQKLDGGATAIDFAFEVGCKRPSQGTNAYEYTCRPIRDPNATDPLEEIRKRIKALPAPAKESEKSEKPAAKK